MNQNRHMNREGLLPQEVRDRNTCIRLMEWLGDQGWMPPLGPKPNPYDTTIKELATEFVVTDRHVAGREKIR